MARSTTAPATDQDPASPAPTGITARGIALALLAVASVSTSAVLIRLAGEVSAYEIAFWRLVVAATILTPPMLARGEWPATKALGARRFSLYGAILAAHFIFYNLALRYSPIAHVLPILYTSTIFVAILSALVLGERLRPRQLAGIGIVLVGVVILAGFDPAFSTTTLLGDGLALLSAIAFALYSLVGRRERSRVPLLGYAVGVYALAALWTAPLALSLSRGGYTLAVVLALFGLGLIPNALGHTLYNASLRRLNATVANVLFTQEITGAILLGWLVLGEEPTTNALIGAVVMVLGIIAVLV